MWAPAPWATATSRQIGLPATMSWLRVAMLSSLSVLPSTSAVLLSYACRCFIYVSSLTS